MATLDSTFFHGGVAGLRPGVRLRPASQLESPVAKYASPAYVTDPDFVYVTTDRRLARAFAAIWIDVPGRRLGGGDVYEVTPLSDLLPDPDPGFARTEGLCFATRSAEVSRVLERDVERDEDLVTYANTFTHWGDGLRMFDDQGFALPSAIARELGITAADLRALGRNVSVVKLKAYQKGLTTEILLEDVGARGTYLDWHRRHSPAHEVQLTEVGFRLVGWL